MNITLLYHWMTKLIAPALLSAAITLVVTLAFLYEQQEARKQLLYQELSTQAQQLSEWLDKNFSIYYKLPVLVVNLTYLYIS